MVPTEPSLLKTCKLLRMQRALPDHHQPRTLASSTASAAAQPGESLSQIARLMAERMTQSWTTVPHFFLMRDVDCTELMAAHKRLGPKLEKSSGTKLTITDLLIAAVGRALAKHPIMNASWTGTGIRQNSEINISLAMAVKDGVVGAVIHKADSAKLGDISMQRRDLAERARANRLRPADISGRHVYNFKSGHVSEWMRSSRSSRRLKPRRLRWGPLLIA